MSAMARRSTGQGRSASRREGRGRADESRLDTIARIESPEQVRFEYRLAGPARRGVAYLIDLFVKVVVVLALSLLLLLGGVEFETLSGWTTGLYAVVIFMMEWGYFVLFETLSGGRTPGKRAMKLRVVKSGGYPINFMDALLRNLLRAADFLPSLYALGVLVMGLDVHFRRLGDLVAGTMVVVEQPSRVGAVIELKPPARPEELATMPAAALLRADEREALDLFVRRLDRLSPARADELAALVLPGFADRLPEGASAQPARSLALLYLRSIERVSV